MLVVELGIDGFAVALWGCEVGTWVMHFDAEADGAEEEVAGMRRFGAISRLY